MITAVRDNIVATMAKVFGFDTNCLFGRSRKREYADMRHVVMTVLNKKYRYNKSQIGRATGYDPSTVLNAINQVMSVREKNLIYIDVMKYLSGEDDANSNSIRLSEIDTYNNNNNWTHGDV